MNARYYVPSIGRFASADTLVPDPTNPQSYNRYSYVRNSPLNRIDPTGHVDCALLGDVADITGCNNQVKPTPVRTPLPSIPAGSMVTFDGCSTCSWSEQEQLTIQASATVTGTRLAQTLKASHGWNLSAHDAFLLVYRGSVNFYKTGQSCLDATGYTGCWGRSTGRNSIEVFTDAGTALIGDVHWAVHELGHSYVNAVGRFSADGSGVGETFTLPSLLQTIQDGNPQFPNRPSGSDRDSTWGFAGGRWRWQRSSSDMASEEFADMYLGWVYGQWETIPGTGILSPYGSQRSGFMNDVMPFSVDLAIGR